MRKSKYMNEITNNQFPNTKQISIINHQSSNTTFGYLNLVIGDCLVIACPPPGGYLGNWLLLIV